MRRTLFGAPLVTLLVMLQGTPAPLGPSAARAALPNAVATKVEPRLLLDFDEAPDDTVSAWIEFSDKGEQGPGDLARRLASASQALSPRARARRARAHVEGADYLDLPIEPAYLD